MTVERTQLGHQTRYVLRDGDVLSCVLTFGTAEMTPPAWKILLPGPGGTDRAAGLADAVNADPPLTSNWRRQVT
jgi:hypothetical protein